MKQFIENIKRGLNHPSSSIVVALSVLFLAGVVTLCSVGVFLFGPIGLFVAPVVLACIRLIWLGFRGE